MSSNLPESPSRNDPWTNPATGETFVWNGDYWQPKNEKYVSAITDTITGTLKTPSMGIDGALLTADEGPRAEEGLLDMNAWQGHGLLGFFEYKHIIWDRQKFLCTLDRNPNPSIGYSYNGKDWFEYETPSLASDGDGTRITKLYSDGKGRLLGSIRVPSTSPVKYSTPLLVYSDDGGATWNKTNYTNNENNSPRGLAYSPDNNIWCTACDDFSKQLFTSTDGINWTRRSLPGFDKLTYWGQCAYGNGRFILPSTQRNTTGDDLLTKRIWYSDDGINWQITGVPSDKSWRRAVYGNNTWVCISNDGGPSQRDGIKIIYSLDNGETWAESASSDATDKFYDDLIYDDDHKRFVAVARNTIAYSYDGINWEISTGQTAENGSWISIAYSNTEKMYVAVNTAGWNSNQGSGQPGVTLSSDFKNLYWKGEKVQIDTENYSTSRVMSSLTSLVESRIGTVSILQDSTPEVDSFNAYSDGELWYQPSTNTLHIRDSDDWVALFQ